MIRNERAGAREAPGAGRLFSLTLARNGLYNPVMRIGLRFLAGVLFILAAWCAAASAAEEPADRKAERLVRDLAAEDFATREKASVELRAMGAAAQSALEKALQSKDAEVKSRAEVLLREIRWRLPPELAARLGDFAGQFAKCPNAPEQERLELLAGLRRRAPVEARRYVLEAVKDQPSARAKAQLAGMLAIYRGPEVEAAVLELSRGEDTFGRLSAAVSLGSFPGERALGRLAELAADTEPGVRRTALEALARRGPEGKGAAKAIETALADNDETVRAVAAGAAGRTGQAALAAKLWRLAEAQEVPVRVAAIEALGELAPAGDEAPAAKFAKLLDDPLPAVRSEAVQALVGMRGAGAAEKLAGLLADADPSLAAEAAGALAVLGGRGQFPALRRAAEGAGDESLAQAALRTLIELGDQPAAERAAGMLTRENVTAAETLARALAGTGDPKWAAKLAEAEKHWNAERFTALSLELRDAQLRDPEALLPRARLAAESADEWAGFLSDHALFAEAAESLEKRLAGSLDRPAVQAALGCALLEAGHGKEGMARMRLGAEMDPMSASGQNNLAWFLLTASRAEFRDKTEGLRVAERAAALAPRSAYILDTHAWALHLNGKRKEALARIDEALRFSRPGEGSEPAVLEAHRARILAGLGRKPEAEAALAAALRRRPRDPRVAAEAARACCDLGDLSGARKHLERMLELGFPDVETIEHDPDLAAVRRAPPEFKALLERAVEARRKLKAALPEPKLQPGAQEEGDDQILDPGGAGEGG